MLIKNKFKVDINVFSISYFQLKGSTPMHLISNVVYTVNILVRAMQMLPILLV